MTFEKSVYITPVMLQATNHHVSPVHSSRAKKQQKPPKCDSKRVRTVQAMGTVITEMAKYETSENHNIEQIQRNVRWYMKMIYNFAIN